MSPVISSNSTQHVHHMLVFLCATLNNSHVGTGSICGSANVNIQQCRRGVKLIGAWAVGASVSCLHTVVIRGGTFLIDILQHYNAPNKDIN